MNQDIIQVNNHEKIVFFGQKIVNINLEACYYIRQIKWYYLILKVVILSPESSFSFDFLVYSDLVVCTK